MAILREEGLIVAVLIGSFVVRFVLADWNSYWLDELYSVAIYGVWNESLVDMARNLAQTSVHPPLYQAILFQWMGWFGDSEAVTRTLSNIFVTGATLFLYLLMRPVYGRLAALFGAGGFTLMYSAVYYGLETRSYAFTMFLVAASSYLLLLVVRRASTEGWPSAILSSTFIGLMMTNGALLLTHYYNIFFLAAQGMVCLVFVVREIRPRRWLASSGVLSLMYGVPIGLFALAWGRQAVATFQRMAGDFSVEDSSELVGFFDLLRASVLRGNLSLPQPVLIGLAALAAVVGTAALAALLRRGEIDDARQRDWTTVYLFGWLVLPLFVVVTVFAVLGAARYSNRYFLFSAVPLLPVMTVVVRSTWAWLSEKIRQLARIPPGRVVSGILVVVLLLGVWPGTVGAATNRKADWRGTAESIAGIIESDHESRYVIFETSFRQTPVLDYYLARLSDDIRVTSTIRRHQEGRGGPFSFETNPELLDGSDFMIVPFIQHRPSNFPLALERLEGTYDLHLWQISRDGRGIVIFRTS